MFRVTRSSTVFLSLKKKNVNDENARARRTALTRTDPAIHTNKRTTQWKKDDFTIELRMAELKATRAGRAQRSAPAPSVRYALADLVSLKIGRAHV